MIQNSTKILIFTVVAFAFGIIVANNIFVIPSATIISSNEEGTTITYHAAVCKKVTRADGQVEDLGCSKNLFTRAGMNFTRDQLSGPSTGGADMYAPSAGAVVRTIGIANKSGAPLPAICLLAHASTDTFLCGELTLCGLARGAVDAVRVNGTAPSGTAGNWSLTKEFTYTCGGTADINATGLFNSTTVNDSREVFFAENTFTTATLNQNDKINITWFVWVT